MIFFLMVFCIGIPTGLFGFTKRFNFTESCECGVGKVESLSFESRIINGLVVEPNTFPWVVYLTYRGLPHCGGTIINNIYVLTAAHCVHRFDLNSINVVVGAHIINQDGSVLDVEKIIIHPKHQSFSDYDRNDIALIKLEEPLDFSSTVAPICLPSKMRKYTNEYAIVAGWGTTKNSKYSRKLLHTRVRILPDEKCTKVSIIRDNFQIKENMCSYMFESDSCQGDSGSTLFTEEQPYNFEMIGIVSWGLGCGQHGYPGVYVRLTTYINWIYENTRDATYCTPAFH